MQCTRSIMAFVASSKVLRSGNQNSAFSMVLITRATSTGTRRFAAKPDENAPPTSSRPQQKGSGSGSGTTGHYYRIHLSRHREWNRAISAAERLVGYPTTELPTSSLFAFGDNGSFYGYISKLIGSDHPLLRTVKSYIQDNGMLNTQIRGLLILVLSRAAASTQHVKDSADFEAKYGVLHQQRTLAETIEMIYAAQIIHKSVLNLPPQLTEEDLRNNVKEDDLAMLEYGNKLTILGADVLLARASNQLAQVRDTFVTELTSISIADFSKSEFFGHRDIQGRFLPVDKESITLDTWIQQSYLAHVSLLSKGCRSAGLLAKASDDVLNLMERIGSNFAYAINAFTELEPYCNKNAFYSKRILDLSAAPVLFHLQKDPELAEYIKTTANDDVENLDFDKIYEAVRSGTGVSKAQKLCSSYARQALEDIDILEESEAKEVLKKMVMYLDPLKSS